MFFHPDHSGIAVYASDYALYEASTGNEVTVVTGFSFYPDWEKKQQDKGRLLRKDIYNNVKVLRGYLYVPKKQDSVRRILSEISFIFFALLNFIRAGKHDIIIVFTTPVSLGVLGVIFKKIYKARLVINVQDLQVEAASSLGLLRKNIFLSLIARLERYTYKKADLVCSISEKMVNQLKSKLGNDGSVSLWPNWIDLSTSNSHQSRFPNSDMNKKLDGKIRVVYAGNIGKKQGLEILLDLASELQGNTEFEFFIYGKGAESDRLKKTAEQKNLSNLSFHHLLEQTQYYSMLQMMDIVFVCQRHSGDYFFPSKLLGILATGNIVMVAAHRDSELYRVVNTNAIGIAVEYDNLPAMKQHLLNYRANKKIFDTYKSNGRRFVEQFDREKVLQIAQVNIRNLL